jgi:adenylate cyclase
MSFFEELKRRNVVRMALLFGVAAWLLLQMTDVLSSLLPVPEWAGSLVVMLLILGFPLTLIFSWVYEMTPEGLKREKDVDRSSSVMHATGRKIDILIVTLLGFAIAAVAVDRLMPEDSLIVEKPMVKAVTDRSIAVLPFVNMSDDPNNEYFADGISEEILNLLANIPELQVTSRSSAFSFKGQNVDVPTMAATLNVAHVLEGSVRKSGDQLRITAQLIRVATDTHLWSETYDRELKNVFEIQDEIAATVATAMEVALLGKKPSVTETNPDAYALYLQGQQYARQFTSESSNQAVTLFKQSLEIDPGYAPARENLGTTYFYQTIVWGLLTYENGNELARLAYQQALDADPDYGRAYAGLGRIEMFYDWDFVAAARHLRQALALSPGDATILSAAARLEMTLGRIDEAIDLYRRVNELDPLFGHIGLGTALYVGGQHEEAADWFRTGMSLYPGRASQHYRLSRILLAQGDLDAALETIQEELDTGYRLAGLALIQHARGDSVAADVSLKELIEIWSEGGPYQIAEAYAFRGESDEAFAWLEKAYEVSDSGLNSTLIDPLLSNLHDDPRWPDFLDKMGLPN